MKEPYAPDPGKAASPDWRTWFHAPEWLPGEPSDACDAAWLHLRASGVHVDQAHGVAHFHAFGDAASAKGGLQPAIRLDFAKDPDGRLRLRYRPTVRREAWRAFLQPLGPAFFFLLNAPMRWAFALRVDRILRSRGEASAIETRGS